MKFGRALPVGSSYPYDWGFVPSTLAEDADPLDALVIHEAPSYPGVLLTCRPLGIILASQEVGKKHERNSRVIAVMWDKRLADVTDANDLPSLPREELERFFLNVTLFMGKKVRIDGWRGPKFAAKEIHRLCVSR